MAIVETTGGNSRLQKCTTCGKPSIPGLKRGHGKCQYHWNAGVWGEKWADEVKRREQAAKEQRQ